MNYAWGTVNLLISMLFDCVRSGKFFSLSACCVLWTFQQCRVDFETNRSEVKFPNNLHLQAAENPSKHVLALPPILFLLKAAAPDPFGRICDHSTGERPAWAHLGSN